MRRGVKLFAALAAVLAVAFTADTVAGSRAESQLAHPGEQAYISGFPYALGALTGEVPRVSVERLDAQLPGLDSNAVGTVGTVDTVGTVGVDVVDYVADTPGSFTTGTADVVRRRVRLDGVGFGELLDIADLDIANPYDISPAGGSAAEAQLTGTPPGAQEPATVVATLRLENGKFHLRPSRVIHAPDGADAAVEAFTLELDTTSLPLDGPADHVQLVGGSIEFSRDRVNTLVTPEDFRPIYG